MVLIKNGKIWDGEKFFYGDILTNDKHIEKIDTSINENADYIYDATGKLVSAGLVDIHVHLKGISCEEFGEGIFLVRSHPTWIDPKNSSKEINNIFYHAFVLKEIRLEIIL